LQKAHSLFREGLGEIGFAKSDFPRLSLQFYNGHQRLPLFKMFAKVWKEALGIDVHLNQMEWTPHLDSLMTGKFQLGAVELNACWRDPLHLLEFFEEKTNPWNLCSWEHPHYQKMLRQAKQANTIEERNRYLKQAEALLAQHMPVIPLYQLSGNLLKKKVLKDVFVSDTFEVDFKWTYKEMI
jgi:oligopeptide transport system substrate-binding protein